MHLNANAIPRELNNKLWACLIAPRPIALISTVSDSGIRNIGPYNSFTGLATYPPMLGISFSKRQGLDKNTLANIKSNGSFVINLVPRFLADLMMQSAEGIEPEDDFTRLDLKAAPSGTIDCPRIVECPASLECRMTQSVLLPPSQCELIIAQIVGVTIRDEYVREDGSFDPLSADLLASVGPEDYISMNGETLFLPRTWE